MRMVLTWECRYCGVTNQNTITADNIYEVLEPRLFTCDVENGGCDHLNVVRSTFKVTSLAFGVEGEGAFSDLPAVEDAPQPEPAAETRNLHTETVH